MNMFRCLLPSSVSFGAGKMQELSRLVKGKSILLLSDKGVAQSGITGKVAALCAGHAASVYEYAEVPPEPSEGQVTDVSSRVSGRDVEAYGLFSAASKKATATAMIWISLWTRCWR